jgi:hypothetical protein
MITDIIDKVFTQHEQSTLPHKSAHEVFPHRSAHEHLSHKSIHDSLPQKNFHESPAHKTFHESHSFAGQKLDIHSQSTSNVHHSNNRLNKLHTELDKRIASIKPSSHLKSSGIESSIILNSPSRMATVPSHHYDHPHPHIDHSYQQHNYPHQHHDSATHTHQLSQRVDSPSYKPRESNILSSHESKYINLHEGNHLSHQTGLSHEYDRIRSENQKLSTENLELLREKKTSMNLSMHATDLESEIKKKVELELLRSSDHLEKRIVALTKENRQLKDQAHSENKKSIVIAGLSDGSNAHHLKSEVERLKKLLENKDEEITHLQNHYHRQENGYEKIIDSTTREIEEVLRPKVEAEYKIKLHELESKNILQKNEVSRLNLFIEDLKKEIKMYRTKYFNSNTVLPTNKIESKDAIFNLKIK